MSGCPRTDDRLSDAVGQPYNSEIGSDSLTRVQLPFRTFGTWLHRRASRDDSVRRGALARGDNTDALQGGTQSPI
jgi:hypothetical protein